MKVREMNVKYITNRKGKKTDVIMPIKDFERLLEDLDDLAEISKRKDEEMISHEKVVEELKRDGFI